MDVFNSTLTGFIYSTIGIIIGWILNQVSQILSSRQEDKKSLKHVTYNLLETYHWILRCDFETLSSRLSSKVIEKVPESDRTHEKWLEINEFYSNFINQYLKPQIQLSLKDFDENYKRSIEYLSEIDPISAFHLHGKNSFLERLEFMENSMTYWKGQYPDDEEQIEASQQKTMKIIKPDLIQNEIKDLEQIILKLALKISIPMWWRTKRTMNDMKSLLYNQLDEQLDNIFDQILPKA